MQQNNKKVIIAIILMAVLMTAAIFTQAISPRAKACEAKTSAVDTFYDGEFDGSEAASSGFQTGATSMTVMEVSTARVLKTKNAFLKRPMASTTKVMTAIVALKKCKLSDIVKVDKRAVGVEGSSIYLQQGDKISVEDLLYGLMLRSGNDAATALAYHIAGGIEEFAKLMNEEAREIGALNTNFVNPHGLHHDNHYTTAYDLALISAHGMRNPEFKKIVGTKTHKAKWEGRDYVTVMHNKNKILNYSGGTGVKTGFTKKAGRCLVASSMQNGMEVVCVVLNCGPMFEDCYALMQEAHNIYKMVEVLPEYYHIGSIAVNNSKTEKVNVYSSGAHYYPMTDGEKNGIHTKIEMPSVLEAPVKSGYEVGKIKIYYDNQLLFVEKLYTIEEANTISFWDRLDDIISNWNRK